MRVKIGDRLTIANGDVLTGGAPGGDDARQRAVQVQGDTLHTAGFLVDVCDAAWSTRLALPQSDGLQGLLAAHRVDMAHGERLASAHA